MSCSALQLNALGLQQQQPPQEHQPATSGGEAAQSAAPAAPGAGAPAQASQPLAGFQPQLPPPPFSVALSGAGAFPFADVGAYNRAPFVPGYPPPLGFLPGAYLPPPPPDFDMLPPQPPPAPGVASTSAQGRALTRRDANVWQPRGEYHDCQNAFRTVRRL